MANIAVDNYAKRSYYDKFFGVEAGKCGNAMCGDNQRSAVSGSDLKTCPSECGGAGCDQVTAEIFNLNEYLDSWSRPSDSPFGLISGCGGATGCSMSTQGRLTELMADHLTSQNQLTGVLQRSAKVDNLIASVNSSRSKAEDILREISAQLTNLRSRVERVQNLTNSVIEDGQTALKKYENLTRAYYDELVRKILGLKHTSTLHEALELGTSLERLASRLRYQAERILAETAVERQSANDLRERAELIMNKAKSFLEQMNKLANASTIYDELEASGTFDSLEEAKHREQSKMVKEELDRLETERQLLSQDISAQVDQAEQNAAAARRLHEESADARRQGQTSLQNLQMLNTSFGMLDEKLDFLTEAMDKMVGQNGGATTDPLPNIQDPSELAKQVNAYIEKLEEDLAKVESLTKPLDYAEEEALNLTNKLEKVVKEFKTLGSQISPNTKHQQFCS
uniref:Laminin subunit beta-1 n=1 Tax=Mesocestoides corti TaxID=53468 RepID=A0A5K3F759_MESCO